MPPRPATASILYPASSSLISGRRTTIGAPSAVTPGAVGLRATSSDEPGPTLMAPTLGQGVETSENLVDVSRVRAHVKDPVKVELGRGLCQQVAERGTRVPRKLRVLLDDAVGVVTRAAGLDQREQRALREQRAVRGL